jgi:hypothetical protein
MKAYVEWMYRYTYPTWTCVRSFTPRPFYLREKNPLYPLDRRLGEPQNRSGRRERKQSLLLPVLEFRPLGRPLASRYANCPIPALYFPGKWRNTRRS